MTSSACALTPRQWDATFSAAPLWCSGDRFSLNGALLRGWRDTSPFMAQTPLTHHCIVLHRGGPKKVTRATAGSRISADVPSGGLTLTTAGTSHHWQTEGPIGFTRPR